MARSRINPIATQSLFPFSTSYTTKLNTATQPIRQFTSTSRSSQFGRSNLRYQRFAPVRSGLLQLFRRWRARPTFKYEASGVAGGLGGVYFYNTDTVPVSGRRRFNIISPAFEVQLGVQQYQQVLQQYRGRILSDSDPRSRQVKRVLERLIPNSGLPADFDWKVHVIDSEETNAFVIPGGKVFVFTGILPICGNDDGLAAVLSHEVGHTVARHIAEKSLSVSKSGIFLGLAMAGEVMLGVPGAMSQQILSLGLELPGSRAQESEADYIGLMMMARSCFNPQAAVTLWQRMQIAEENHPAPPELLSTHPGSKHRQERLQELLPKAQEAAAESACGGISNYVNDFRRKARDDFSFSDS